MKTATLMSTWTNESGAIQRHYRLSEPLYGHTDVVVSAVYAWSDGPETLIFPCAEDGTDVVYSDLGGVRGSLDHERALALEGFQVDSTPIGLSHLQAAEDAYKRRIKAISTLDEAQWACSIVREFEIAVADLQLRQRKAREMMGDE